MRRYMLLAVAVALAAPVVAAQWVENLEVQDGWVAPGEFVLAQKVRVAHIPGQVRAGNAASSYNWDDRSNALSFDPDGQCARTTSTPNHLFIRDFGFTIPSDVTITGILVLVIGSREGDGSIDVSVGDSQGDAPVTMNRTLMSGACAQGWTGMGGSEDLWGKSWTPARVNSSFWVEIRASGTNFTIYVDAVRVIVYYAFPSTVELLTVRNTALGEDRLEGSHVDRIEIVRERDGKVIGYQTTASQLAKLTTNEGVPIVIDRANRTFIGKVELQVRVRLKSTVPLLKRFVFGDTRVTIADTVCDVDYWNHAAAVFRVGPPPTVGYDGLVDSSEVYRGQKFLAGRIVVNAAFTPFEVPINQVRLRNVGAATTLAGSYISKLEIRRASDDALVGEATSTELAKLTTTWTVITPSSTYNKVPAYGEVQLEIWVTLKSDVPAGHNLRLDAVVRCQNADLAATGTAPSFTVGQPGGLEEVDSLDLSGGQVFSRQRFLAQRIEVRDDDLDSYDVTINSLMVQNVTDAGSRLAETHIALIEVVRGRDGALMGSTTSAGQLNSGGVRVTTSSNNIVRDDTSEVLEIWVTLGTSVPDGRGILLRTVVWHTEDSKTFYKPPGGLESAAEFTTGPATGAGFETADIDGPPSRTVFQGVRFLAQRLELIDDDADPYDVTITSLMIRNVLNTPANNPLADQHVARVEVRRKSDGALLGEVTDPVGLSLAGVRVTTGASNVVPDDTGVELEIWITLNETAPADRKLRLECTVWHTEGAATFQKVPSGTAATFTTAIGQPPRGVDFSWAPAAPEAGVDVTFTPAAGIADPSGNIANATFSWNFGDGKTAETKGSAAVKHKFGIGGTFQVTLTVTGEGGLASSKTNTVEVIGKQPVVDFTFTPATPAAGQEVRFTSQVTDPATPPLTPYTYAWAFGDGGTSAAQNPTHTYAAAGTYTVVLSVTNNRGEVGRKEKSVTVAAAPVNRPPVVTAVGVSPQAPEVGQAVTFTATATDPDGDPITGYEWDFGDGSIVVPTTSAVASHTFATSNVFTVRARARDAGGFGEWFTTSVYIRPKGGALIGTKVLDNPARMSCRIQVFLPTGATGPKIQIFDALGRPVLVRDVVGTQFTWDLKDNAGRAIADGLYFYLVTATVGGKTERSEVGKILIVR